VQNPFQPEFHSLADTIRRTIRVLGTQPTHVSSSESIDAAARVITGRLSRAGVPVHLHPGDHGTPLIVAGNGPIAVVTYLDDTNPLSMNHDGHPPALANGVIRGSGIERKAGVVAAIAPLLVNPALSEMITILVETDRHSGSQTLENWLTTHSDRLDAVVWEACDLPLHPPVVIQAATGVIILEITLHSMRQGVEPVYGTVLPDLGIAMAVLLSSLKTGDDEVRLEGFYDGIDTPSEDAFDALMAVAPGVKIWTQAFAGERHNLTTAHMTLGLFCAPSIIVRSISMPHGETYLPAVASAVIELQLMPGQSVDDVLDTIDLHVRNSRFEGRVDTLLVRPPVGPSSDIGLPDGVPVIPIAPGLAPASLFQSRSIPGVGYAVVDRRHDREEIGLPIASITDGALFLLRLVESLGIRSTERV
jgi:hypothetical protein